MKIKSDATYPFMLSWSHYLVLMRIESDAEDRGLKPTERERHVSQGQTTGRFSAKPPAKTGKDGRAKNGGYGNRPRSPQSPPERHPPATGEQ